MAQAFICRRPGTTQAAARQLRPTIGENRQLVTDEPVEFEKSPVEVQDCRKITDHFRGIYRMYLNSIKENRRMSTCNRLHLQIPLGSQPIGPKNLPDHWLRLSSLSLGCGSVDLVVGGQGSTRGRSESPTCHMHPSFTSILARHKHKVTIPAPTSCNSGTARSLDLLSHSPSFTRCL
jgi:hypothetical protein